MHFSHILREGARPEIVRDNMGHANIDVTQIVYGEALDALRSLVARTNESGCPTDYERPLTEAGVVE
jgi:hypothetical protein